jgi:hypothetical protein
VLPASNTPSSPRVPDVALNYGLIAGLSMLVVYTLFVAFGLLSGSVAPERAYTLMSLPPLLLAAWNAFGWWREPAERRDFGLLLAAAGWLLAAITLWVLQRTLSSALANGARLDEIPASPLAWVLGTLAFVAIVAGAALSLDHWKRLAARDASPF